jgi:alkanesulfonate monooxygenase SsuD/methylene tetrahydromethanopterin reductase-like flavin-dependent oxidoreductase (luciferase family)
MSAGPRFLVIDGYHKAGRAELAAEVSVWGSVDQVVAGLREVTAAGAELVMLNPVFDEVEQLEVLAAEVVPRL